MKEILDVIHKTIYQFFDVCGDDEEAPMSDKDKLLLEVNKAICNKLKTLEQEPKTGYWRGREVYAKTDYRNGWIEFTCEKCEYQHGLESGEYGWSYGDPIPWKYCPMCGAKMIEPQESEEKECTKKK